MGNGFTLTPAGYYVRQLQVAAKVKYPTVMEAVSKEANSPDAGGLHAIRLTEHFDEHTSHGCIGVSH